PEFSAEDIAKFKSGEDPEQFPNKRHYDDLLSSGSGVQTNHYLSASGGTSKSSYLVSFGYLKQEGLIAETFFKRYNMRVNLDNKLSDKLKLNVILSARSAEDGEPTAVDRNPALGVKGLIDYSIKIPNGIPGKMSNGYYGNQTGFTVEGWMDSESYINTRNTDLYGNVSLDYNITKSLKITGKTGYDFNLRKYEIFRPLLVVDQFITQGPSELRQRNLTNGLFTNQIFVNYDLPIGSHDLHMLAGFSQESFKADSLEAYRDNFPNNALYEINAGSQANQQAFGSAYEWALRSFFGRVTYNYKERYLFEANARYDGSSRFPEDNRWGIFPSLSGGWRISEESFFSVPWMDELKLRASWGKLGNQNIGNYPYQQVLSLGLNAPFGAAEVISPGAAATVVANSNINWESTRVYDVGFDASFLSGKLSFTADYYDKLTSGILYNITASSVLGLTPSVQNAGVVSNKGIDLDIRHQNSLGDFSYSVSANFSYVKNEVVSLSNVEKDIANGWFVGSSLASIYGYVSEGLFVDQADIDGHASQPRTPKPGTIKFKDISGPNGVPDGIVDADYDRKIIGNRFPKYNFGATLNARYKGFDLSVLLQGVAGVNNIITGYQGNAFIQGSNPQQWMYDGRWTEENPDPKAVYPRLSILGGGEEQFYQSTYVMSNASYFRINNLQLGYAVPQTLVDKMKMTSLRFYASVKNLTTFDQYRVGWDPGSGIGYPPVRVYNFGVNLSF
ncbi:MAG TPA: SusC/RagA family TonB-linked outer membrane protein, partial [Chryseolinea sp.]|nr:SusC/RagA family TonB-linked outer membrane protein [Chryseolinea sp.]